MTYVEYLRFYGLKETEETYTGWLYNEWQHGRVYQYEDEFYRTDTGKRLYSFNKVLPLADQINSAASKVGNSLSNSEQNFESHTRR